MKEYWRGRKETTIERCYGSYILKVRYFANINKAQVTMYDMSDITFPIQWSETMTDEQANSSLQIFESCGYFGIA